MALAACDRATPRNTGLAESTDWCLQLDGLAAGHTVTGKLATASVILTLTVVPRDPWMPWPASTVLIGLILAGTVLMVPERLGRRAARMRLWDKLARNNLISGLDRQWVESLITDGTLRAVEPTFVDMVIEVIAHGPQRLAADRRRLAMALASCTLPPNKPLLKAAAEQAKTGTRPQRTDLLTKDGRVREQTPPQEWLARIGRAETILAAIGRLRNRLSEVGDATDRARLASNLDQLVEQVANAGPEESAADTELTIAEYGVSEASWACRDGLTRGIWFGGAIVSQQTWKHFSSSQFANWRLSRLANWRLSRLANWRYRVLLWLTVFGVAAVLMIFAAVAVFSAGYINTGAFGTPADYLSLGVAAFGSTALTGVVGILLTIRRP